MKRFGGIGFILGLLVAASSAYADKVILRSGLEVDGRILEQTDTFVKIDFLGTPLVYYLYEVDSVDGQKVRPSPRPREERLAVTPATPTVHPEPVPEAEPVRPPSEPVPGVEHETPQVVQARKSPPLPEKRPEAQPVKVSLNQFFTGPTQDTKKKTPLFPFRLVVISVLLGAFHVYVALCLGRVARKVRQEPLWWAWAPAANFFLMARIAKIPYLWTSILLAGVLPISGPVIVSGFFLFLWREIAKGMDAPDWVRWCCLIPGANFFGMAYLAYVFQNDLLAAPKPLKLRDDGLNLKM